MELENDVPPPPYSEVDPSIPPPIPHTSTMGGGEHSPTSTLRPTSSQSMRAPSFITLRGGWLRGVPFDEDPATESYFQGREFEFDPNRRLVVLHREITSDTTREDLPYPDLEQNRDVTEQDWSTLVNYILTELGTETSVRHRKKLSAEEFYERQTKLEALISEWNEAFFQPRSIKFIAHYYHKAPGSPDSSRRSRRAEARSGMRRIEVEDGPMDNISTEQRRFSHHPAPLHHGVGPLARGGPFTRGGFHGRGGHGNAPFLAGGLLGSVLNLDRRGDSSAHQHERERIGPSNQERKHVRRSRGDDDSSDSSGSSDSCSSDSESEAEHRRGSRPGGQRGRRDRRDHRHDEHRRRSHSASSESSFSSVSSISSRELQEPSVGALREAIAHFRLDPTNNAHNRVAYKQLLKEVRQRKQEALRTGQSGSREIHKASKSDRRAIRDDLRKLRFEAKRIAKHTKRERKAARKEAKKARKEAKRLGRVAKKAGKKSAKGNAIERSNGSAREIETGVVSTGSYNLPGTFPNGSNEAVKHLEQELRRLEEHVRNLNEKADREVEGIAHGEKRKLARANYDQEIREIQNHIASIRSQILQLGGTSSSNDSQTSRAGHVPTVNTRPGNAQAGYGTLIGQQGEAFGRYMQAWGEQFGRDMEQWGEDFGRRVSQRFG